MADHQQQQQAPETRYNQLLRILDASLSKSREAFNVEEAIKECYGDDASMFEVESSSEENFLASAINAVIGTVNETTKKEMLEYLEKEGIEQKLNKIEDIIAKLDRTDAGMKQQDADDRQAAQEALEAAMLPKGVSPSDVMRYHANHLLKEQLASLEKRLAEEEEATKEVQERKRKLESSVRDGDQKLQKVKQTMEKSAAIANDAVESSSN